MSNPNKAITDDAKALLKVPPEQRDIEWVNQVKDVIRRSTAIGATDPVSALDQALGFLTTPIGKHLFGFIFGWIDGRTRARVRGHIKDDAKSTDGYITLDIEIEYNKDVGDLHIPANDGRMHDGIIRGPGDVAMIRVEIVPKVGKTLSHEKKKKLKKCTWVTITGKLMWDLDGFFEIHPESDDDIVIQGTSVDGGDEPPPPIDPTDRGQRGRSVPRPSPRQRTRDQPTSPAPDQTNLPNPGRRQLEERTQQSTTGPSSAPGQEIASLPPQRPKQSHGRPRSGEQSNL